jgi:hypothetical protein
MRIFKQKPSPAMIVAITALFISLVGTAFAGPIAEISLNKGEKKQIRKITRKVSNRVANRRITKRAPGLNVATARNAVIANVANASNSAINAQNAQNAENAENAESAETAQVANRAGDLTGRKIDFRVAPGTGATQVLNLGGFILTAACDGAGNLTVIASTTVNDAFFLSRSIDGVGTVTNVIQDTKLDISDTPNIVGTSQEFVQGHTTYENKGGSVVSVTWQADEDAPIAENNCVFSGTALQG